LNKKLSYLRLFSFSCKLLKAKMLSDLFGKVKVPQKRDLFHFISGERGISCADPLTPGVTMQNSPAVQSFFYFISANLKAGFHSLQ
jgi:hypothetical protein